MSENERRAVGALAAVFAMRLLGLFMIYPVFEAYAHGLRDATPVMIGLALGAYGLTQGLLQIPFGLLSDRIGRKIMITIGLLFFAAGSVIAARAGTIEGVLIGRILQGAGAVGSVILALVADLTRPEVRTRAMAMVGITIGLAFVVAIVLGPVFNALIGVSGIFWLTALLALVGIGITLGIVPRPERLTIQREAEAVPALFTRVLRDRELLRLDVGIFSLHAILTASFLGVPPLLTATFGIGTAREWMIYLPVLAASVALMVPAVILAERGGWIKEVFIAAIAVLLATVLALGFAGEDAAILLVALTFFFAAFNSMEAMLPSLVSRFAPPEAKGTALGIYSSLQFLGIFIGGAVGGLAASWGGPRGVFIFATLLALLWLATAIAMPRPAARPAAHPEPNEARPGGAAG
ncbi:MAG TPA: MFS transporter [Acetobacteraceae bacterium]|nr:MFS transporter [Acetobacteraceae bacterium]